MNLATTPILSINIERRAIATCHWRPVRFAAQHYSRSYRTILQWCESGQLAEWNIRTYKDARGRWWIHLPQEEQLL